jgi:hypothetical protein
MFAFILVFSTYNPEGFSYVHWVIQKFTLEDGWLAVKILVGIVLIIGWAIFIRATARSLGLIGFVLSLAFFSAFILVLYQWDLLTVSGKVIAYAILFVIAGILTVGISWSHIRRRLTGQVDVDEIEGGE